MPATVPASIAVFADLVDESIQTVVSKRRDQPSKMEQYCNTVSTNSYYEKDSSVGGIAKAKFTGPNASVVYDAPIQGFDKTYTQRKFTAGLKFDDQVWRFGFQLRKIVEDTEFLMDSFLEKIEDDGADLLNNGYSTSYTADDSQSVSTAGGDSVAFFSASHTREDGGTAWGNRITDGTTVNMDFEYDGLKALRRTAAAVVGPVGLPLGVEPDTMICKYGSTVHSRYEELMGAINRNYIPGGNENDGAAVVGLPKLITLKYLDNDAYWFAFDSKMKNGKFGLQWKWNMRPTLKAAEIEYDTDLYKRAGMMFYDRGANDMRNFFASKGTNAA